MTGSRAASASGPNPRRSRSRSTRARVVATTRATSASLGGGAAWKTSAPRSVARSWYVALAGAMSPQ